LGKEKIMEGGEMKTKQKKGGKKRDMERDRK